MKGGIFRANILRIQSQLCLFQISPLELKTMVFSLSLIDPKKVFAWLLCETDLMPELCVISECLFVFLSGLWLINLCVSVCMFVYMCVYPELGGACESSSSSIRHAWSSWALPPRHLPQRSATGNCQVTLDARGFMWDTTSIHAEVNNIFLLWS